MADRVSVEFWFDPACPFAWQTSRWLLDVTRQRPVSVTWRLMSLRVLNEGKETPPSTASPDQDGHALRVLAAAEQSAGQQALGRLYTALGTRRHEQGQDYNSETFATSLVEAGLGPSLADAVGDEQYDTVVRASHDEGQARVGTKAGSPILAIDGGRGYFGPVVAPAPVGDEATTLFDALRLLSSVPAFSELKTARSPL